MKTSPLATEIAAGIRAGHGTSEAAVRSCLDRIAERENEVGAWQHLDPEQALEQARIRDAEVRRGLLHGVPVGIKDIFDTVDMPTEYGSPIYRGYRSAWDAACVASLRAAGAVILGKTVTTEFAVYRPGKTANPHNLTHTPGGSSSGSAAAVADHMVPLALGTQTAGSIVRPAAFCGVVGYKPSYGLISRSGMKLFAESLDTVGAFARSVADAALIGAVMAHRPALADATPVTRPPRIGYCRTHQWHLAQEATVLAFDAAVSRLREAGADLHEVVLPECFRGLYQAQERIMAYEGAQSLASETFSHGGELSDELLGILEAGRRCTPDTYDGACALAAQGRIALPEVFGELDALLVPSVLGEAPKGLHATGDPAFNRVWTLLHVPCLNLPGLVGPGGLPVGVQLVGRHRSDRELFSVALWAEPFLH